MENVVYDSFTAADSTSLVSRTANTGQSWTKISSSTTNPTVIIGNRLAYNNPNGTNMYTVGSDLLTHVYTVEADIIFTALNTSYVSESGILARWDGSTFDCLKMTAYQGGSITFSTNGTVAAGGSYTSFAFTVAINTTYHLKLVYTGASVSAYVDSTLLTTASLTPKLGKPGVYIDAVSASLSQPRLDEFYVRRQSPSAGASLQFF